MHFPRRSARGNVLGITLRANGLKQVRDDRGMLAERWSAKSEQSRALGGFEAQFREEASERAPDHERNFVTAFKGLPRHSGSAVAIEIAQCLAGGKGKVRIVSAMADEDRQIGERLTIRQPVVEGDARR